MSEPKPKLVCKNCGCDNHPHYDYKYDGLCLPCSNARVDEHLDRIRELEHQLAAANQRIERMEAALKFYADESNWTDSTICPSFGQSRYQVALARLDKGHKARSALADHRSASALPREP